MHFACRKDCRGDNCGISPPLAARLGGTWRTGCQHGKKPAIAPQRATMTATASAQRRLWEENIVQLGKLRLVDLSVPLESDAPSEPLPPKIRYLTHEGEGLEQMKSFFGIRPEDLVYS